MALWRPLTNRRTQIFVKTVAEGARASGRRAGSFGTVRQVLSVRLLAAVAVLIGLALLLTFVVSDDDSIAEIVAPDEPIDRRADVMALVLDTQLDNFSVGADGRSQGQATMLLAPPYDQTVTIHAGTPGVNDCAGLGQFGQCALVAQLLGDSIAAFHLVPMGVQFTFELPAIVELEGGLAFLVDGWQVPYADVIDRSACDTAADSFAEFLRVNGTNHRSVFSLGDAEITAVVC